MYKPTFRFNFAPPSFFEAAYFNFRYSSVANHVSELSVKSSIANIEQLFSLARIATMQSPHDRTSLTHTRTKVRLVQQPPFPLQIIQVQGNLKVKLSKSKEDAKLELIEPSVIGFVGQCRVVDAVTSILEILCHCSMFTVTRSLDMKKFIWIDSV